MYNSQFHFHFHFRPTTQNLPPVQPVPPPRPPITIAIEVSSSSIPIKTSLSTFLSHSRSPTLFSQIPHDLIAKYRQDGGPAYNQSQSLVYHIRPTSCPLYLHPMQPCLVPIRSRLSSKTNKSFKRCNNVSWTWSCSTGPTYRTSNPCPSSHNCLEQGAKDFKSTALQRP